VASKPKKRVEEVMPIATGHEREELEAELEVCMIRAYISIIMSLAIYKGRN